MTQRFAVVGNPVAHSLSPRIHQMFGAMLGIELAYERLLAPLDDFEGTLERFFGAGGSGLNVTVPFKERAFAWVSMADAHARRARAVNTIALAAGRTHGFNTDGLGLLRDLRHQGVDPRDRRFLIAGAGGAVRGALGPLLDAAPREVVVTNRTMARAEQLAADLADPRLRAVAPDALDGRFDVVINGTSTSLLGTLPPVPVAAIQGSFSYDMAYAATPTRFVAWAVDGGAARAIDGLGMLIEQAALAFERWHGVLPDTAGVRVHLRRGLAQA
jgi:shikimate dehydrogenase